ncbi:MAG: SulP family inorganic anion transporter [Gammaproteobacteria bacterium]|nr:SulP family inorganic anion transporter [Gammaproteobacteria bacterium]
MHLRSLVDGPNLARLRGDIYGGLTAAVVALPLALAFGVASGAGPIAGMYGAICVGFFAALFGGTPSQVSGPTGPMTVVMAAILAQYTAMFPNEPGHAAALAFTVVMAGGALQIAFGALHFGKFIELVPLPVISGFMSGIGVIIILLQLPPLLGGTTQAGPMASALAVPAAWASRNPAALGLGICALAIVYLMPRAWSRWLPSPLVALLVGTLAAVWLVPDAGVPVLGDIPSGLPALHLPVVEFALLSKMFVSALTLAALGSIDSLLTSLVADSVTRTYHDSDRELLGQGIGNIVAGLFGGLPGAGATMRTVVNVKAGGRTPVSGALHSLVLLTIVLGAGGMASHIPHAVLAGILIKVGTDIIDWDFLRGVRRTPGTVVFIMSVVLLLTVFVDLIKAVAVGMAMAGLVFMKRMSDLQLKSINVYHEVDEGSPLQGDERRILRESAGQILLIHFGSPMSFGAAKGMTRQLSMFTDYRVLVLDLSDMPEIDFTATRSLFDVVRSAGEAGRSIVLCGGRPAVMRALDTQGIRQQVELSPGGSIEANRIHALRHAETLLSGTT